MLFAAISILCIIGLLIWEVIFALEKRRIGNDGRESEPQIEPTLEPNPEPATPRQLRYLELLANKVGATLQQSTYTRQEATEVIEVLREERDRQLWESVLDWSALLDRPDVLIVDTETAGLGNLAQVTEVAVLDTTGELRYEAWSFPKGRISSRPAYERRRRERLKEKGARPWPEVHGELVDVLQTATLVLAWNAGFDQRMLAQTSERNGLSMPELPWHDLMRDYKAMTGGGSGKDWHSLSGAVISTGAGVTGKAHNAARDCRAVLAVMRAISRAMYPRRKSRDR